MSEKDSVLGDIDPIKRGGRNEASDQADGAAHQPPEKDSPRVNRDPAPEMGGTRNFRQRKAQSLPLSARRARRSRRSGARGGDREAR
jgi:hypothetical protein